MMKKSSPNNRGAALLLSLWALFLLSAMVVSWALNVNAQIALSSNSNRGLEAEANACSGAEIALHPTVKAGSPLLRGSLGRGQSFQTRITGEGGRLNLNWILAGENPTRLEVLRKYLERKGVDLNEREKMVDCLLDWVDPDNIVRLNGAEDEPNYHPSNALLTRLEDLKKVRGWQDFTSTKDWDADFTLSSTGPIDIAWASKEILMSLPGMDERLVDAFITLRAGPDGIDGTEDDPEFKSLEEVRVALGFSADQFKQLTGLIGFKDPVLRVVSVGNSGDVTRTVRMVIRKSGNVPQLITWKEL